MTTAAPWHCYLLATEKGDKTYVGVTPDLDRRLAQHNGEKAGGAKATHGKTWTRLCHVRGFPDHRAALQFEWRWKQLSRPPRAAGPPVQRRLKALQTLLALDRSTTAAAAYSEWPAPPEVVWEAEGFEVPEL
jgi:predicted GIY-YIG superfamily endonuclease